MRELREHSDTLMLIDAARATVPRHLDFDLIVLAEVAESA